MTKTTDTRHPCAAAGGGWRRSDRGSAARDDPRDCRGDVREELAAFLGRLRCDRDGGARKGYRHGRRDRQIVGTFGAETVSVPRARIEGEDGRTTEWQSKVLPRYQRLTKRAEALIAAVETAAEVETRRKAFLRKGRLKCRAVADSLKEAGERSPSPASIRRNGNRREPPTRSSASTRSFAAASRPGPCCPAPRPCPCCSGRCSPRAGSPCARSTDGRPFPEPIEPANLDQAA